jgi:hypothetical protein
MRQSRRKPASRVAHWRDPSGLELGSQSGVGPVGGCGQRASTACEHMFVSIKGSPYTRFRRAVQSDSPTLATAAAHELPQLDVADALRLCLVYARADRRRFDRAIVRWHARLCLDARTLEPTTAQTALAAAVALPGPYGRDAALLLAGIAAAHDLADVAEVLDEWRVRPDV